MDYQWVMVQGYCLMARAGGGVDPFSGVSPADGWRHPPSARLFVFNVVSLAMRQQPMQIITKTLTTC